MKQISEVTIERARRLMLDGRARSYLDISNALSISGPLASHAMRALHDRGQVYVARFDRNPGSSRWRAVYHLGQCPDAVLSKETCRKRAHLQREREYLEESRASGRVVFRHPYDVAFFGEYQRSAA